MRQSILVVAVVILTSVMPLRAETYRQVLTDSKAGIHAEDFSLSSADLGLKTDIPWSIRKDTLHGGKQEGVELIEVNNGRLTFSVIPTRGMSIYKVWCDDITLGWDSPVKEVVHPSYIELESRGGLGWLDGFNEMVVRCGFEFAGHPGEDNGRLLSLHGRAGNIPASKVEVVIDEKPPHRIRIRGRVDEKTFKFVDYQMWTEISTAPGSASFRLSDTLTNLSDYEREFQIIYHGNFGPPLLEKNAEFVAAVKQVTPFDDYAAKDMKTWTTYLGPTKNYGEQVYNVIPHADPRGQTTVMLRNAAADRGVTIRYSVKELPYLTLWKNTDTLKVGYVTGLEPGTGFPYNRSIERAHGRVPKLKGGAARSFNLEYTVLLSKKNVQEVVTDIKKIQGSKKTRVDQKPAK